MEIAIWIIAIVEVIRMIQNFVQLYMGAMANKKYMKTATDEFVKSLNKSDAEFVEDMLKKIQEKE